MHMRASLFKDNFREIVKSPNRFISIFLIVALGTAFFAGIKAAAPDMKATADAYYDDHNMMDIRVLSTMGLTDGDIEAMRQVEGVNTVQASYFTDVVTTIDSSEFVYRIHALPADALKSGSSNYLNKPDIIEGRLPQKSGECIIESLKVIDLGLRIGDVITVSSGKKEDLSEVLATDTFTVVGIARTPYYLTYDKDASDIGSGKVNFFMMILSTDFVYPVYTEALITVNGANDLNSYSTVYQKLIDRTASKLDNVVSERSVVRLAELKAMALAQLDEAKADLAAKEADFDKQIADGQAKLDAAQDKIIGGQATLETEKKNYDAQIISSQKQIDEGEKELAEGQSEYNAAVVKYNEAQAEYGETLASLDQATQALNSIKFDSQVQIDSLMNSLNTDTTLTDQQRLDMQSQIATLQGNQTSAQTGLDQLTRLNTAAQTSLADAETQLATAKAKLKAARAKLDKAKADLAQAKEDAEIKFAAAEKDIAEGTLEYDAAKKDFDIKKADGEAQIEDGKEQVIRGEDQIERLSKPGYYVLDRNKLYSYADYAATADRMDAIAKIFPLFFLCVAVLVCLTTMTRMVDEQRGTIGTFKALGYRNSEIVYKYVNYAALASTFGGVFGVIIGLKIFPKVIFDSWSMMYTLPPMIETPQLPLMVLTVIVGITVTTAAAYAACNQALITVPSQLMRPKAPKAGKTIVLEKIHVLWKHFSFSQKVTARNLIRYKKRFFMTIIGIAGCSALLVAGFGLSNSIGQIVNRQFKEIFKYNLSMKYTATATGEEKTATVNLLTGKPEVKSVLKATEMNAKVKSSGDEISFTFICPEDSTDFLNYITLRDRVTERPITLSNTGFVINEKLAKELGVGVGDSVSVDNGDGAVKKLEITGITENYIFHYGYISKEYYTNVFRLVPEYNSLLIRLNNTTADKEKALGTELIAQDQVASVLYYSDAATKFRDTVKSLDAIVYAIISCAGLLAFVVLYNLTNINVSERIREIATIKVLGFYNREVATYVYRENVVLSIIGAAAGLGIGVYLHRVIMSSIEQNGVMFGNYISPESFLYSFGITLVFTMLVNIFMYRRLKKIPMVESLKTVE